MDIDDDDDHEHSAATDEEAPTTIQTKNKKSNTGGEDDDRNDPSCHLTQEQRTETPPSAASDVTEPRGRTATSEKVSLQVEEDEERDAQPPAKTTKPNENNNNAFGDSNNSLGSSARKPRSSRIGTLYRRSPSGRILVRKSQAKLAIDAHDNSDFRPQAPEGKRPLDDQVLTGGGETDTEDVTWGQVYRTCCCHSTTEWMGIFVFIVLLLTTLYFFLVGLDLLSTGFKVAQGCTAGTLLGSDTNPLASLMIGIIATALLQSSSTTTAIVVSLVSGGLDVDQGIYIVMGANVGTSVTAMLVSLAHTRDGDELERAFAGSALYYIFNIMTAIILLPLEITTKYLHHLTETMLPSSDGEEGESWEGPIRTIVQPIVKTLIIADKDLIADISTGEVESCSSLYPVYCIDGIESYETCNQTGLIACNKDNGKCPAFFQDGANEKDDIVSAYVALLVGLFLLIICLVALVALLHYVLAGASVPIIYKATNINPILAMAIGCGVTVFVQSSSITTSTLVPLCGVGILSLENLYPLVLGADIGTTVTALMAALVSAKAESLQIALAHLFFNVTGIVLWYPVPLMRRFILRLASWLGKATRHWRSFPLVFICVSFFGIPLLLLGISSCFEQHTKGFTALGTFIMILFGMAAAYFWFWWSCRDGKTKCQVCIEKRQRRAAALKVLADDMDFMKVDLEWCRNEIGRIKDFAGRLEVAATKTPGSRQSGAAGEEDLPMVRLRMDDERTQTAAVDEELVSLYESCHSKPWRDVLQMASGSIKASLEGSATGPI